MRVLVSIIIAAAAIAAFAEEGEQRGNRGVAVEARPGDLRERPAQISGQVVLPPVDLVLPQGLGLWSDQSAVLEQIRLDGNTVLDETRVDEITAGYLGHTVTSRDLQDLRENLSREYVDAGYINSGVLIPDQSIGDGSLTLQAVEGSLTKVEIVEIGRLRPGYVEKRLSRRIHAPLNVQELQSAVQLLHQDRRVKQVNAELVPGNVPGEAELRVGIVEARPWQIVVSADNHRAESVGAERGNVAFTHYNLTGFGDVLSIESSISKGSDSYSASYLFPYSARGHAFQLYHSVSDSSVLEEPFNVLDVDSTTKLTGMALSWKLKETLTKEFSMALGFEVKESETLLLGQPFSLSPGAINGVSKDSVATLSLDWVSRTETRVFAARLNYRQGLPILDATDVKDNPDAILDVDGEFKTTLLQFQYLRRLGDRLRFSTRLMTQIADGPLLSLEKLAVGGASTVRGYRENFLVRDNGVVWTVEFPVALGAVTITPFVETGMSWDEVDTDTTSIIRNTDEKKQIVSAGLGFNWRIGGFNFDVEWASQVSDNFKKGEDPRDNIADKGLQDNGVHFSLTYSTSF